MRIGPGLIPDPKPGDPASCATPPTGMVAWFPFDEVDGTTAFNHVKGNDGTYTPGANSPAPTIGKVQGSLFGARFFDSAQGDRVIVPVYPELNLARDDFAVDAWVKTGDGINYAGLVQILDTLSVPAFTGFNLYLQGGTLRFGIGDGSSYEAFDSLASISDNEWHHVAVYVQRLAGTGVDGEFWVDGQIVNTFTSNTVNFDITTTTSEPLLIGAIPAPNVDNIGSVQVAIDEVEIFRRPARFVCQPNSDICAEIHEPRIDFSEIYTADYRGKCKDTIKSARSTALCPNEIEAKIRVTLCNNNTGDATTKTLTVTGLGTGNLPDGQTCDVRSQGGFAIISPQPAEVPLNPGECKTVPVTLHLPSTLLNANANEKACYRLDATGVAPVFGSIWRIPPAISICPLSVDVFGQLGCAAGFPFNQAIPLQNTGPATATFNYQLTIESPDPLVPNDIISLDGQAPGQPVTGQVIIPSGQTADVVVQAQCLAGDPYGLYSLVLSSDTNGDNIPDPMTAITMAPNGPNDDSDIDSVPDAIDNCIYRANTDQLDTDNDGYGNRCDPDLNNDGFTNSLDLGLFKPVFFTTDPDADFNADGIVNSLDLGIFKDGFFKAPGPSALAP